MYETDSDYPHIVVSEESVLIEFIFKSSNKLLVKPHVTVGLSFCSAAFHDEPSFEVFLGDGGVLNATRNLADLSSAPRTYPCWLCSLEFFVPCLKKRSMWLVNGAG